MNPIKIKNSKLPINVGLHRITKISNNFNNSFLKLLDNDLYGTTKLYGQSKDTNHTIVCISNNTECSKKNKNHNNCIYAKMDTDEIVLTLLENSSKDKNLINSFKNPHMGLNISTIENLKNSKSILQIHYNCKTGLKESFEGKYISLPHDSFFQYFVYEICYIANVNTNTEVGDIKSLVLLNDLDEYIYVSILYTEPQSRGKGYSTLLLNLIKERAKKAGKCVYLTTFGNDNLNFYTNRGFKNFKDNEDERTALKAQFAINAKDFSYISGTKYHFAWSPDL